MGRSSGCILLMLVLLLGTTQVVMHADAQPTPSSLATGIELEIDFGNDTIILFSDVEGTDVLSITEGQLDLVVEWYGNLAYVTAIEGVSNDPQAGLFWQYWVNDELAPVAANLMTVNDTDHILWRRTSSNFITPPGTEIDSGVLVGIIVIGILGPVFLGILQAITMRRTKET